LGHRFRVRVAAVSTFVISQMLNVPLGGLWAILTAVIMTEMNVGRSLKTTVDYLIGTLGGVVYAGAIATLVPHTNEVALAGVLALDIAPLALLAAIIPSFRVAPFTAVLVLLGPLTAQAGPIYSAFDRVTEVALGGITVLVVSAVSLLVLPARAQVLAVEAAARGPVRAGGGDAPP
jgi:uncharacterized membrane protein YccC